MLGGLTVLVVWDVNRFPLRLVFSSRIARYLEVLIATCHEDRSKGFKTLEVIALRYAVVEYGTRIRVGECFHI
jgi:hypothetical protein